MEGQILGKIQGSRDRAKDQVMREEEKYVQVEMLAKVKERSKFLTQAII